MQACKHPLAIEGEGDIVERLAGVRGCTLEEFRELSARCTDNEVSGEPYVVSYEPIPRAGWVFTGWEGGTACGTITTEGYCEYDVTQAWVEFFDLTLPGFPFPATTAVFKLPQEAAVDVFEDQLAEQVLEARCMACHVEGGLSGFTRLVFDNHGGDNQAENNIAVLNNFVSTVEDGRDYLLTKVRGGNGHGGGSVFSSGSEEYKSLAYFLALLNGETGTDDEAELETFWQGVTLASPRKTLRRAAIIVAQRLPTEDEYAQAEQGEAGLRAALRGLMEGEGFHNFLVEGANDRLLTNAIEIASSLDHGPTFWPALTDKWTELYEEDPAAAEDFKNSASVGVARAPLELIAHVVESEGNYQQILTADYIMVNPFTGFVYQSDVEFEPEAGVNDFLPGQTQQVKNGQQEGLYEQLSQSTWRYLGGADFVQIPHAGILTTPAFMERYPTTTTNRNRARARWTFLHFLGVDIELSAARTKDPDALADRDNPTLNNPNCTVCHRLMDPVAGAFQNFDEVGTYRVEFGKDSLPSTYKHPQDFGLDDPQIYVEGDTWYRDMLLPGLGDLIAPRNDNSLQWLGQQIVNDPRFAMATIRFWWLPLMGSETIRAPEIEGAADSSAKLEAFEAQQADMSTMATAFSSHWNLKDLLVDMMMSHWFRGDSTPDPTPGQSEALAFAGTERLLTPRQLEHKLLAISDFALQETTHYPTEDWISIFTNPDELKFYLGGIDSRGINSRPEASDALLTQSMSFIALQSACGMIADDWHRPNDERRLLKDADVETDPDLQEQAIRERIVLLHELFLGETLATDDREVDASYAFYLATWQQNKTEGAGDWIGGNIEQAPVYCTPRYVDFFDREWPDSNHVLKSWLAFVAYLMLDYRFLHE